jgi:hypothetical protein
MMNLSSTSRGPQRGAAALAASMLLLFGSSIVVFYLNRGLIFEQKTSANQLRSTAAFEVAEAGIEWATGMLNRPYDIDANCNLLATANVSFLRRYIQTGFAGGNTGVAVTTNTFPGCKVNGTTLTCGCPTPAVGEQVANPGAALQSSFTVAFAAVNDPVTGTQDPTAVRVTSTGCTPQAGMCKPLTAGSAATTGASDANATVSVILKLNPTLRAAPSAALTCGTSCAVGGSYDIFNYEVASNGYLVNAGTTITQGPGTNYGTIPGQPVQNALIPNDPSLSALSSADPTCTNSSMFNAYFGSSLAQYAASPEVRVLPGCDNPSTCGGLINTAYNEGWRSFYFPDGMSLNNSAPFSVLGAAAAGQGVNLVSAADININGNITINGLVFSNSSNFNDLGTGTANINGAIISCAAYSNNGNGTLSYNSAALGGTGLRPGLMVRVPGSWRDQATAY